MTIPMINRFKPYEYVLWTVIAKILLIVQMVTVSCLGLFAPTSTVASIITQSAGATNIFIFQLAMAVFLILDLIMTDHSSYQRRSWRLEYYTPTSYMLAGVSFLSVALISTGEGWSYILIGHYFASTLLAGGIAVLLQLKRVRRAIGLINKVTDDL